MFTSTAVKMGGNLLTEYLSLMEESEEWELIEGARGESENVLLLVFFQTFAIQ